MHCVKRIDCLHAVFLFSNSAFCRANSAAAFRLYFYHRSRGFSQSMARSPQAHDHKNRIRRLPCHQRHSSHCPLSLQEVGLGRKLILIILLCIGAFSLVLMRLLLIRQMFFASSNRYRHEFKSQELWSEIKIVLDEFAAPLTDLFKQTMELAQVRPAL